MSMRARLACVLTAALIGAVTTWRVEAHKPITSPYTFTEDVLPILRDRCATCHFAGGPAPMALTTPEETVPWGESIRLELVAGHMPPWSATSNGARLRHAEGLSARELNVLLTWVSGGTPPGDAKPAPLGSPSNDWALGEPDQSISLPEVSVSADQAEVTREVVLPFSNASLKFLRAVDLRPGTRSLVRSARVELRAPSAEGSYLERVVALWVPGDRPVPLPERVGFLVPYDAELVVTLRLKKTWEHEREAMSDKSTLGVYFADARSTPVRAFVPQPVVAAPPVDANRAGPDVIPTMSRLLSVYPTQTAAGATITIDAVINGVAQQRLIEFRSRPGWDRRYTFDPPIVLPLGTALRLSPSGAAVVNAAP
jgi:hypothetical protein